MKREILLHPAVVEVEPFRTLDIKDAKDWLQTQATWYELVWLLAHADDGVIWGKVNDQGQLVTSHEAAKGNVEAENVCPPLRIETLQQARLFAKHAELLLWRDGDRHWQARLIRDAKDGATTHWDEAFDEPQMLWGTHGVRLKHGFTLLRDGAQGLRHAIPPLGVELHLGEQGKTTPPRLLVRHYLGKDDFACVVASRLVNLEV